MMINAAHFLITTLFNILTILFLLRFLMQATKTSFFNPIGQVVLALTDFAVKPARKFIPSWKKNDLSTLVLAFVTQLLLQFLLLWLSDFPFSVADVPIWSSTLGLSLMGVISAILDIFLYAILIQAILSWVNPHTPIGPVLQSLTRPVLNPIRRIVPAVAGIDFSPLIAIILLQMLNISIIGVLQKSIMSAF